MSTVLHQTKYRLRREHGHLIAEIDGGRWVVDTGSPVTFGDRPQIVVAGKAHTVVHSGFLGAIDAAWLRNATRCQVDGLIGTDVLTQYDVIFDLCEGTMVCSEKSLPAPGNRVPMSGAYAIESSLGGVPIDFIFDTGAQLSYVPEEFVAGLIPRGRFTDFYPLIGEFDTPTYRVDLFLGDDEMRITAGVLPPLLGCLIPRGMGILGNEVLHSRPAIWAPRRHLLSFLPATNPAHAVSHPCVHLSQTAN